MLSVILHIGRHKTGTSSLQHFFVRNRERLKENGIYYPKSCISGYGHHKLASAITEWEQRKGEDILSIDEVSIMKRELASVKNMSVLISSEGFQNVNPAHVKSIFIGFQVTIVVYLREQCGYLGSAYAQRIQASNEVVSLDQYYRDSFSRLADYPLFLSSWEQQFPKYVKVSVFDKKPLA